MNVIMFCLKEAASSPQNFAWSMKENFHDIASSLSRPSNGHLTCMEKCHKHPKSDTEILFK